MSTPAPGPAWTLKTHGGVSFFELNCGNIRCRFFTRQGGVSTGVWRSLNLSFDVGDEARHVAENRARLQQLPAARPTVLLRQVHSALVHVISEPPFADEAVEGDALITDRRDIALGVKVADCLPVYLFVPDTPVIGIAHAGWRGTLDRIAEHAAEEMLQRYGVDAAKIRYAFGPCIDAESYPVGRDVVDLFRRRFPLSGRFLRSAEPGPPSQFRLDLKAANRQMLNRLDLSEVADLALSTYGRPDLFFSARRDRSTGRNLALIQSD